MKKTELTVGTNQGEKYTGQDFCGDAIKDIIVKSLSDFGFKAFTVFECLGYWEGVPEKSYRFEIYSEYGIRNRWVKNLARDCQQDCIMVVRDNGKPEFIG